VGLEEQLAGWTGPSSATEQDKQERTERMIREAIKEHAAFDSCDLHVYAKGSYANNTNVKTDSDVDIAVQCGNAMYWDEAKKGTRTSSTPYKGIWTPSKLRSELELALRGKFPGKVDSSGSTAFCIHSSSARVDADVVPCFDYRYYLSDGSHRDGAKVHKKDGASLINWPDQQLKNGRAKNSRTSQYYKKTARIMKRVENAMVVAGAHREVPSFFVECLVYNCPDEIFLRTTWTATVKGVINHIYHGLDGAEPAVASERWLEVSECKYLFSPGQAWDRTDGRAFAKAAWNYLKLGS
jgi:hypothetical protein